MIMSAQRSGTRAEALDTILEPIPASRTSWASSEAMDGLPGHDPPARPAPPRVPPPARGAHGRCSPTSSERLASAPDLSALDEILGRIAELNALIEQVERLSEEFNPMLGHRGVPPGATPSPRSTEMQVAGNLRGCLRRPVLRTGHRESDLQVMVPARRLRRPSYASTAGGGDRGGSPNEVLSQRPVLDIDLHSSGR